jgi:iron complex outermembrane receptor protein
MIGWWSVVGGRWVVSRRWVIAGMLFAATTGVVQASQGPNAAQPDQAQLRRLSIEELMQIDITTASREAEPVRTTAAALTVITSEDIRRAGVTTLADALVLADGVHVARSNSGAWSISARGFNGGTPNKLLVMVNGRTVYSPLFAGVFWNMLDYALEDIDRIEVIRGPGATLWGSNALNGVINIITRSARDTIGTFVTVASGNEDPAIVEARHGGMTGAGTAWRVYGKFAGRDAQLRANGLAADDGRERGQAGFRVDGGTPGAMSWFVTGDAFHSRDDVAGARDGEFTDLSLQGRWSNTLTGGSRLQFQSYYRREYRRIPNQLTHRIDTVDVDGQHSVSAGARHALVWGGGARLNRDDTDGGAIRFDPMTRNYPVFSVFAQDTFEALPNWLTVIGGVKWEHNAFSGGDLQPNVRARLLLPGRGDQLLWGAVSRGTRRPTRFDDDIEVLGPGGIVLVRGSDDFESERLLASELGYRIVPHSSVSLEATFFQHRYTRLRSQELPPAGVIPIVLRNTLEGRSRGLELGVNVQPRPWWRTHVGYTALDTQVTRGEGSRHVGDASAEANDPNHLLTFRTSLDLPRAVELDALVRSVGALPSPAVPAYTELTLRGGWFFRPRHDIWIVGEDLLHDQHQESAIGGALHFQRSIRAGVTLRF